jgi:hypothetical protein
MPRGAGAWTGRGRAGRRIQSARGAEMDRGDRGGHFGTKFGTIFRIFGFFFIFGGEVQKKKKKKKKKKKRFGVLRLSELCVFFESGFAATAGLKYF